MAKNYLKSDLGSFLGSLTGTLQKKYLFRRRTFVQFKKRKKHPWMSVTFSKIAGLKVTLFHGCFSHSLNCTNGTKLRKASQMFIIFLKLSRYF